MNRVIMGILTVALYFGGKFGVSYLMANEEIEDSKNQPWPPEFKAAFVSSCSIEAEKNYTAVFDEQKEKLTPEQLKAYSSSLGTEYCTCVASDIENQHILPTKYNQYEGQDKYAELSDKIVGTYVSTEKGINAATACNKSAIEKLLAH